MIFRSDFRKNVFTRSVVWCFDLEEPESLSLQVSKMHINKVMADLVFMGVLFQEEIKSRLDDLQRSFLTNMIM